ncbi:MAG: DNA translocase FtsK [Desulfamplus sp.]|nr:DNA translocase FtsK [Desulfamplus sp.]
MPVSTESVPAQPLPVQTEYAYIQMKTEPAPAETEPAPVETDPKPMEAEASSDNSLTSRSSIANWKLRHSYLAMKRKAMEKITGAVSESQSTPDNADSLSGTTRNENPIITTDIQKDFHINETKEEPEIPALQVSVIPPLPLPSIIVDTDLPFIQINPDPSITVVQPPSVAQPSPVAQSPPVAQPLTTSAVQTASAAQAPPADAVNTSSDIPTEPPVEQAEPAYIINRPEHKNHIQKPKVYRKGEFQLPNLSFLKNTSKKTEVDHHSIRRDAELLEKKLGYFGIKGEVMGVSPGPVITTFEYRPEPGIKISKIVNLADDLALALSAFSIRIVAPIPGKDVMGIEIPNIKKSLVPFIDIVNSDDFINTKSKVPICLGKDIIGNPVVVELDKMPHLLIAGATGTGKSVGLNAMITSILYKSTPEEVRFLMVDPKRIELSFYNDIPHLLTPVITDMKKATIALQWMVREMDRRYSLLAKSQVRHIEQYNQKIKNTVLENQDSEEAEHLPFIVVIIDELADLMMTASRDIEFSLARLAQMARAAGIHLILATQRPSVDVLTGIIKANFPTRISFQVSSKTDSRTIIDSNGAETLLGNGDMLFVPPGTARLTRVHGTYLSENELMDITTFLKSQGKPEYVLDVITENDEEPQQDGGMDDDYDDKYNEALDFVVTTKQASISGIQRALRVGYNRAARIIDIMEKRGIVGPSDGVKPRRVIVENIEY